MKVSLNWLKELVELPATVAELTELLTLAGVEVEGIETRGVNIEKVVIAQILESVKHPQADRLSVCKVDDGTGAPKQIVCGAKNYKIGDKVPLAQAGAVLPGDFKIKVGKLRGVESQGMMCSAKELGLAEDAEGLLILPQDARVGASLSELFPSDTILDLEITPNRADLLSYRGIAREVAALTDVAATPSSHGSDRIAHAASIETAAKAPPPLIRDEGVAAAKCPFYTARKISGVKVGPSPDWLRAKLEASGLRAINNVVDITNFVMLEMGQPLHAFDADRLHNSIRVRVASDGEEFLALDGRTYKLSAEDLVIADEQRAIAIAGVMGGEETGVIQTTTNILLESAYFQPAGIRHTARKLGLISDSSYRFERGVDPQGVLAASQRATDLICEIAGGVAENEIQTAGTAPDFSREILLSAGRCAQVLGTEIERKCEEGILLRFGLEKRGEGAAATTWRVPSFRQDLTREIDLIEEITRVFGIENIPARETSRYFSESQTDREHDGRMQIRRALAAQGFYEARSLSLIPDDADYGLPDAIRVRNPLTSDQTMLRPTLLRGVLAALAHNARAGAKSQRIFEIGRCFLAGEREEKIKLALVMTGPVSTKNWRAGEERDADLFDVKGVLASLGLGELRYELMENPRVALMAAIRLGGERIGSLGLLWPARARELDVATPVVVAEIELPPAKFVAQKFAGISKFPAVTRDIAMLAPKNVTHAEVAEIFRQAREPLLADVQLFDLFVDPTGERVPLKQRSLAYSLTYRSDERTLKADEVNAVHARLKECLQAALHVIFRE